MDTVSDPDTGSNNFPGFKLKNPINTKELFEKNAIEFEVCADDAFKLDDDYYTDGNSYGDINEATDLMMHCNTDCMKCEEDGYDDCSPFETIGAKMVDVTDDGKIKKKIIRRGCGDVVEPLNKVTIHYNSYVEFNDEPFDSTYLRKTPFSFLLGTGGNIVGLDMAVATMKLNEKSQFLVHPDLAYGKLGCMGRIPGNATILYEIELVKIIESGGTIAYEQLEEEEKKKFEEIYKNCLALQQRAKDSFSKNCFKQAVVDYNRAIVSLEKATLNDCTEQAKHQELLVKLYTNLAVCYNKLNLPKKVCTVCNKITDMIRGTSIRMPAKVHYNRGKALIRLTEFGPARKYLEQARLMEPKNEEIVKELIVLQDRIKEQKERETKIAKLMFKCNDNGGSCTAEEQGTSKAINVSSEFKNEIRTCCEQLLIDNDNLHFTLPPGLTKDEQEYIKRVVLTYDLDFNRYVRNNDEKFYVTKRNK